MDARTLSVSATARNQWFPPANSASSNNNMIVNVMQYSLVQVEATEPFVQLMPKTDKILSLKSTTGNQIDFMKVGVTDTYRKTLEESGFTITLPAVKQADATPTPASVEVSKNSKTQGGACISRIGLFRI